MLSETLQHQLVITAIVLISLLIIRAITNFTIAKVARKNGINEARIRLVFRYVSVTLVLIAIVIVTYIFGAKFKDLALIFSSVFAVIGIGLFAVWSILSNVTSGVIMFFNFPYKVGDKIKIHDVDFPITAIIEDIRAFHLHLRLDNGNLVTYPNNLMLQKAVTLVKKDAIGDHDSGV
ncbi:mechanosensitive ion channel family protein [Oceanihabitans sp. IOP_32]|uniref:mechanosensitive ion channel domain-containing protein n=1 Tax=Oceanihabitans sp. IOP_32 TaxID=2529032 RepID=UPI001293357C|nr:mechanosensitive ion channel family protein [Oceanihabitans sp. IOP_32]QFZ53622.1 mechanosensitive ion channel family protein [Oceanihabitans sp. IOP_32]